MRFPYWRSGAESACLQEMRAQCMHWEDPVEKEIAAHSSSFACEISWAEEPGRLPSMGSQRVGYDLVTKQ